MDKERDTALAKKGQTVGLVIAITMVLWLIANLAGPQFGLAGRYAILFDLLAMAALIWAMVNIWQMWQARREQK